MTTPNIEEIERIAKAAPAGKWIIYRSNSWRRIFSNQGRDTVRVLEPYTHSDGFSDLLFGSGVEEWLENVTPDTVLSLIAEVKRLREDAELFNLLVSTCDALDANAFDKSNQPGTLRFVCKHKTHANPELHMHIIEFIKGYKVRVDAARNKENPNA